MNNCPHCGEALQEGAHFCPYCMTSLDDKTVIPTRIPKRKWRLLAATAVLLFALFALGTVLLLTRGDDPTVPADAPITTTGSQAIGITGGTTTFSSIESGENTATKSERGSTPTSTGGTDTATTSKKSGSTSSKTSSTTTTTTTTAAKGDAAQTNTVQSGNPSSDTETTTTTAATAVTYTYVIATQETAYPPGKAPYSFTPSDYVVITGVSGVATNGIYEVPKTIGDQTVIAIMPSAFAGVSDHVKTVILPTSVRTIWSNAFSGCYNLTDLYFSAKAIGIYEDAFPAVAQRIGTLTFHSPYDSRNFDFYYYRNIAGDYGAQWAQWNG